MKKISRLTAVALALILTMTGFATAYQPAEEKPTEETIGVIVSILPLADFVKNIGRNKVDVTVMVPPGSSPHTFAPRPSQLRAVSHAQMYVKVGSGLGFERAWMDRIRAQNEEMLIVDSSVGIEFIHGGCCCCGGPEGIDPHIWLSPLTAKTMVQNISEALISIAPEYADFFAENTSRYLAELNALDKYIRERLDGFVNRYFLIYHPAFGYLARDHNLTQIAIERDGRTPSPRVIMESINQAAEHNLSYVFVSPQFAQRPAETIARSINGQTALINPLPRYYIPSMRSVVDLLAREME
ncbi:zinc ABC transporter substrate-binding protein [Thermodesulfovibrionales bacterium]|nr:zinc ABC transporter substrate-binding protein [Thermodesulfovibrionales bacterium]MCL0083077.1 zinc ABC transporter substrate-binding protein [Thermodesulfovibrionales bacterium]MCL0096098.1 zinc ABC transporter substrate-binding protein [Thermodesulfovibrionales bacterium]